MAATLVFTIVAADLFTTKETLALELGLPEPSQLLSSSVDYDMPVLKGIKLNYADPLKLQFIVDGGSDNELSQSESEKLLSYFLAVLTTPNENLWVNLSPYEADRVIPEELGLTELGKDMLAQDYILKQLSASLTFPETQLGKQYWAAVGAQHAAPELNKIWIIPQKAKIHENNGVAIITEASLDVKSEFDTSSIILPVIRDEINTGKHFANVRQIYHSTILAMWFKNKLKDSLYSQYINKSKISGIDLSDKNTKDKIYSLYCEAFKKGVYDFTKKEKDSSNKTIKKQYFSGGLKLSSAVIDTDQGNHILDVKELSTIIKNPKLIDLDLRPVKNTRSSSIVSKTVMTILASTLSLFALDLIKGTPNTIGILQDDKSAAQIMWDSKGEPHIYNSRGAANQFAPNNPYDMWSWGQFMNMISPIDSIDDDLSRAGHNSNKVYYAAENLNSSDKSKLKNHINKIYKDSKMATMLMHFGGQYATSGKDNFLLANPTAANLEVVKERVRDFARFCNDLDFGALSGVQLFNEPMFYQAGASSMHWSDAHYAQIGFKTPEEFYDFANQLAGIFKSICPNVPVYYGHGFLEPVFISKIKGRLSNFDAIALNLYPNYPMGNRVMSVEDLINYFRQQVTLAYNELGMPVVVSEFAESSTSKNNDPNWGEAEQAQFAANVMRALGQFMLGSESDDLQTIIGVFWHELFPEAWKDAAIAPTESGLSLYTKDYRNKLAADSLGQGFIRIDSLEQNIETPVKTTVPKKKIGLHNTKINKVLLVNSAQTMINDSFDVPVTVKIHDIKGRLINTFKADRNKSIDSYITKLNLPSGNFIINIETQSSAIYSDPLMALENSISLFEQHREGIVERKQVHVDNVNMALRAFLNKYFDYLNPEIKGSDNYHKYNDILNIMYDTFSKLSTVEQNALITGTIFHDIGSRAGIRDMDHDIAGVKYLKNNLSNLFKNNEEYLAKTSFIVMRHSMMSNLGTDYLASDIIKLSDFERFATVMVNFFDVGARADGTNLYSLDLLNDLHNQAYNSKGEQVENFAKYRVKNAFCPNVMQSYAISNRLDDHRTFHLVENYKDILDKNLRIRSFGLFTQLISINPNAYYEVLENLLSSISDYNLDQIDSVIVDTDIDFMAQPVKNMSKIVQILQEDTKLELKFTQEGKNLKVDIIIDDIAKTALGGIEFTDIEIDYEASSSITDFDYINLGNFDGLEAVNIYIHSINYNDIVEWQNTT